MYNDDPLWKILKQLVLGFVFSFVFTIIGFVVGLTIGGNYGFLTIGHSVGWEAGALFYSLLGTAFGALFGICIGDLEDARRHVIFLSVITFLLFLADLVYCFFTYPRFLLGQLIFTIMITAALNVLVKYERKLQAPKGKRYSAVAISIAVIFFILLWSGYLSAYNKQPNLVGLNMKSSEKYPNAQFLPIDELDEGLNIFVAKKNDELRGAYREGDRAIYFQTIRARDYIFGFNIHNLGLPTYEMTRRLIDMGGNAFVNFDVGNPYAWSNTGAPYTRDMLLAQSGYKGDEFVKDHRLAEKAVDSLKKSLPKGFELEMKNFSHAIENF